MSLRLGSWTTPVLEAIDRGHGHWGQASGQQAISGGYEFTGNPVGGQNPNVYFWYMTGSLVQALGYQVTPQLVITDSGTVFTSNPAIRVYVNCVPF